MSGVMPTSGKKEGLPKVKGWIGEPYKTEVEIVENGVHYLVDVEMARKPDFSWIRNTTVWRCSASVKENGCWIVLPIWEHSP